MVSYTSLDRATCEVVRMVKEAPSKGALPSVLKGLPPSISFTRMNANVSASTGIVRTSANPIFNLSTNACALSMRSSTYSTWKDRVVRVNPVAITDVSSGRLRITNVCFVGFSGQFCKSTVELLKSCGLKNLDSAANSSLVFAIDYFHHLPKSRTTARSKIVSHRSSLSITGVARNSGSPVTARFVSSWM